MYIFKWVAHMYVLMLLQMQLVQVTLALPCFAAMELYLELVPRLLPPITTTLVLPAHLLSTALKPEVPQLSLQIHQERPSAEPLLIYLLHFPDHLLSFSLTLTS